MPSKLIIAVLAGFAAMFCYGLFFKFVGVAVLGGAFITWTLRS